MLISNKPLFDEIYNPPENESGVIDESGPASYNEEGFNDPDIIESILQSMSGELSAVDSRLPVNNGEWR